MIGKLKHSLKDRCPYCNRNLQLRVREIRTVIRGEEVTVDEDYLCCSNPSCDYEAPFESKKRKRFNKEEDF